MFQDVVEGFFDNKPGSCERRTSWQNLTITLYAIDGLLLTARAVTDRVTNLLKKFSTQNNSKKGGAEKEEGDEGAEPTAHTLLQDLVDLNRDSDAK